MNDDQILGQHMRRVFTLTAEECDALWDAWVSIPWEQRKGAIVGGVAGVGALGGAFALVVDGVSSGAYAGIGAALALVCRDSRSESGPFIVEHYEVLTRPWRAVIGAVHPDDDLPVGEALIAAQAVIE